MVDQWSISGHWDHVTDYFAMWSDKMASRKRASSSVSESSSSDVLQPLKEDATGQ